MTDNEITRTPKDVRRKIDKWWEDFQTETGYYPEHKADAWAVYKITFHPGDGAPMYYIGISKRNVNRRIRVHFVNRYMCRHRMDVKMLKMRFDLGIIAYNLTHAAALKIEYAQIKSGERRGENLLNVVRTPPPIRIGRRKYAPKDTPQRCNVCFKYLPAYEFALDPCRSTGRHGRCKLCVNKISRMLKTTRGEHPPGVQGLSHQPDVLSLPGNVVR